MAIGGFLTPYCPTPHRTRDRSSPRDYRDYSRDHQIFVSPDQLSCRVNSQVTLETLKAAICVYLLIGLLWVYIFALIDLVRPGAFLIRQAREGSAFGHLQV